MTGITLAFEHAYMVVGHGQKVVGTWVGWMSIFVCGRADGLGGWLVKPRREPRLLFNGSLPLRLPHNQLLHLPQLLLHLLPSPTLESNPQVLHRLRELAQLAVRLKQ